MERNIKKRYWAMVLYPESAPCGWKDILQGKGIQCAISPLHDKDVNPDNTKKKAHYHIILAFEGPTTYKNVCTICEELNQPIPTPLESIRGYYRYFTHKDNPEKYQYNEQLICTINGFDISDYADLSSTEVLAILKRINTLIRDNDIREYCDLINLLQDNEDSYLNYLDVATNHTFYINTYITSYRHKLLQK